MDEPEDVLVTSRRPVPAKQFRLLQHSLRRLFLLVGRVAVLAEKAADDGAHLGAVAFFHGPEDQTLLIQLFWPFVHYVPAPTLLESLHAAMALPPRMNRDGGRTVELLRARKKITLTHNARCAILPA